MAKSRDIKEPPHQLNSLRTHSKPRNSLAARNRTMTTERAAGDADRDARRCVGCDLDVAHRILI